MSRAGRLFMTSSARSDAARAGRAFDAQGSVTAPSIVQEALSSAGEPLDARTRARFETRLHGSGLLGIDRRPPLDDRSANLVIGNDRDPEERRAEAAAERAQHHALPQAGARCDFSQVRIHAGPRAAASAHALHARAYAVGPHIVFGERQYAPHSAAGQRLLAHELAHVAQPGAANVVRRDLVKDTAGNYVSFAFRVGTELTEAFAKSAKRLTADGTLDNTDIEKLKAEATAARDTVSDHERMFMAGLLDATNVATLQATKIDSSASITFALSTITDARVKQVIEAGQPAIPASVSKPVGKLAKAVSEGDFGEALTQLAAAEGAADKELRSLVGASFKTQIASVISFARANSVTVSAVLAAALKAASDNTQSDHLMAAAAYAIAAAAAHPLAGDIQAGKIRMDALAPANFAKLPGISATTRASYVAAAPINPKLAGLKGDTIYMPTDFDIANLNDRSTVIHELKHAQDDKAASPTGKVVFPTQLGLEMAAYKTQARYILDQMNSQATADRARSATQIATASGDLVLLAVLVEAQTDLKKYQPLAEAVFAAAAPPMKATAAEVATALAQPATKLEGLLEALILKAYGITSTSTAITEGLAGESLIHWIRRL